MRTTPAPASEVTCAQPASDVRAPVRLVIVEPRAESREPRAESREPRAESREPRAESREPRAESREPRAESREPRASLYDRIRSGNARRLTPPPRTSCAVQAIRSTPAPPVTVARRPYAACAACSHVPESVASGRLPNETRTSIRAWRRCESGEPRSARTASSCPAPIAARSVGVGRGVRCRCHRADERSGDVARSEHRFRRGRG